MIHTPLDSMLKVSGTTAYDANDLIGNSATAAEVVPLKWSTRAVDGRGIIRRVRIWKASTTTTAASFMLHLFTASPVPTNGDNGAFAVADITSYIGPVALDMSSGAQAGTASLWDASAATAIYFALPTINDKIYGLLQAIGAYVPVTLEEFRITLEIEGE